MKQEITFEDFLKVDLRIGTIIEVNSRLEDEPELVTEDSMGDGWFIKVRLSSPEELDDLMDESSYNVFIEE